MKKKLLIGSGVLLLGMSMIACKQEPVEEVNGDPPPAREVVFSGKPDDRFVGVWKRQGADIRYTFDKSGTYTYKGTIYTPGGAQKIDSKGEWAVDGNLFYVKDEKGLVSDMDLTLEGSKMTFTTKGMRKITSTFTKE